MASARFDLSAYVGGSKVKFKGKADESGGINDIGTTNIGYTCTIDSGGESDTVVIQMDTVDDEQNFTAGDEVYFFWGALYTNSIIGNVDSVNDGADQVTISFDFNTPPVNATAGLLVKSTVVEFDFTGSNLACIAMLANMVNSKFTTFDTNYAGAITSYKIEDVNAPWFWLENMGFTNPFAGTTPTFITVATPSATETGTYKLAAVLDNTDLQ